jgi:hypothetical protein
MGSLVVGGGYDQTVSHWTCIAAGANQHRSRCTQQVNEGSCNCAPGARGTGGTVRS